MTNAARQQGFTVLETLVALAVFGSVLAGVTTLFAVNNNVWSRGQSQVEVRQNGRIALERMAREMRIAGFDEAGAIPTLASPTAIQTAESNRLVFVADMNWDGTLDRVGYSLDAGKLMRESSIWTGAAFSPSASSELARGLTLLHFDYFDGNEAQLTAPVTGEDLGTVRRITMSLVATSSTAAAQASMPLVVDVKLRN